MSRSVNQVLRSLALPVYWPSVLSQTAHGAVLPVLPLIAMQLGFSPAHAALAVGIQGLMALVGPIPLGIAMERLGERRGMQVGAVVTVVSAVAVIVLLQLSPSTPGRWAFVALLLTQGVGAEIWDLGRQTYLAAELPPHMRGRAMNLFGGVMRIGAAVGPSLGAVALSLAGFSGTFVLQIVLTMGAAYMITRFVAPHLERAPRASTSDGTPPGRGLYPHVVRAMTLVTIGTFTLVVARVNVAVLLPLIGHHIGLDAVQISLVFAVGMALEIVFFLPAGILLDRWGRGICGAICCAGMGVGFLVVGFTPQLVGWVGTPLFWFVVGRLVIALGNVMGSGIIKTLSADLAPAYRRAAHMGLYNSLTGVGVVGGPLLVSGITALGGLYVAGVATGGLGLAGAVWCWFVLPHFTPGWHGAQPPYDPDRPAGRAQSTA